MVESYQWLRVHGCLLYIDVPAKMISYGCIEGLTTLESSSHVGGVRWQRVPPLGLDSTVGSVMTFFLRPSILNTIQSSD